MTYKLYQLPPSCDYCFLSYNENWVNLDDYSHVYTGTINSHDDDMETLEEIFSLLQNTLKTPIDYTCRSCSVSDIIELSNGNMYYCNNGGWVKIMISYEVWLLGMNDDWTVNDCEQFIDYADNLKKALEIFEKAKDKFFIAESYYSVLTLEKVFCDGDTNECLDIIDEHIQQI